jgi:ADP-heptose:LPS heptosyltransferase
MRRILVIKLGALGDFVHAFHAFAAIRAHHAADRVALLTTPAYRAIAKLAPWFDAIHLDPRAPWWNAPAIWRTARLLRGFEFIYDLQTSRRSNRYFLLAGRRPWSGIAPGCSAPHANPRRDFLHTIERQLEQLRMAGVTAFPSPDRDWLIRAGRHHGLAEPYAMLMPGGAGVGHVKQWPIARYGQVARVIAARGIAPVVIGGPPERGLAAAIREACPAALDLTGRTSIPDLAAIAAGAALVLGNDTGPVHLAASVGAPTIVLFSAAGVPEQAAPRGPNGEWPTVIRVPDLNDLAAERVVRTVIAELDRPRV